MSEVRRTVDYAPLNTDELQKFFTTHARIARPAGMRKNSFSSYCDGTSWIVGTDLPSSEEITLEYTSFRAKAIRLAS
jgi:hypothetical protein